MSKPPLGFIPEPITLALDRILPSRKTPEGLHTSRKFKQIMASMEAVGLIEPLSVGKADKTTGKHILLDGHMRLLALRQLGYVDAPCLIATDDESYTYNNRINRISSIQEHHMLRRAVERGVTPERLAKALSVDVSLIHKKVTLLDGICPEATEMLKDQHFAANLGSVLRKMKPTRQVECPCRRRPARGGGERRRAWTPPLPHARSAPAGTATPYRGWCRVLPAR